MALEMGSERVPKWAQPEGGCLMRLSQAHAPELAAPALPPWSCCFKLLPHNLVPPLKSPSQLLLSLPAQPSTTLAPLGCSSLAPLFPSQSLILSLPESFM